MVAKRARNLSNRLMVQRPYVPRELPGLSPDNIAGIAKSLIDEYGLTTPGVSWSILELCRFETFDVEIDEALIRKVIERSIAAAEERSARVRSRLSPDRPGSWVYYMRMGNRVKIGTTTNLKARMATFNPEELMAVEPGGTQVEGMRHHEFGALRRYGSEWFRLEEPLVSFIGALREQAQTRRSNPGA